ncbi:MAG: leucine-rich repeat protein [Bacteroidales bacterium]|nr:leucine-rich repeat protein [Bacteroidales bacterium]
MRKTFMPTTRIAILVTFMLSLFAMNAYADDNPKCIECVKKNSLSYCLYNDTISGELYAEVFIDFEADDRFEIPTTLKVESVIKYNKQKYPVTIVGIMHGKNSQNTITSVILPPTIKKIDEYAFSGMKNLLSVQYDDKKGNLEVIEYCAFEGCESLRIAPYASEVCQGTTLKVIGSGAFERCSSISAFSLPSSMDSLGMDAFRECTSLRVFNFPQYCKIKTLHSNTFYECTALSQIHIPEGVTKIDNMCFRGSGLTEVWFPSTLTVIEVYCFYKCTNLKRTYFKSTYNLERIEQNAFCDCSNFETIDNDLFTVKYIGEQAFSGCKKLVSEFFMTYCDTIESDAFSGCSSLKKVSIYGGSYLGSSAFYGCTSLEEVDCKMKHIGSYAFSGCSALKKVHLQNTEYIGSSAFKTYGKDTSLERVYGLRPDIEYDGSLSGIFDYVWKESTYDDHGCYYAPIERSYQYNVLRSVRPAIKEWEKKKDYEKTSQWAERVTEENRDKELQRLIDNAREEYIKNYAPKTPKYNLGKYDAYAEVFSFTMDDCKSKVYVTVPSAEMAMFKENFKDATFAPEYCIKDDKVDLARCAVTINTKTYTSPTLYEDDSTAVVSINLSPLQINIPSTKSNTNLAKAPTKKSAVDTNIPTTSKKSEKMFVVIIGNENYSDPSVSAANYAQNDADIFEQYCLKTLGIPQTNIHKKLDATRNQIRSEIKWLSGIEDAYGSEAEIVFYYSGHGMPDETTQKAYLLPADGMANDPESAYAITTLYAQLGELDVKRVSIFLDACFSGSQRNGGMLTASKGVAIKMKQDAPSGKTVVFSAAQGDETAYPNNEQGHGMFTYYLLKKLQETKGDVTLKDLGDYITTNVSQQSIVLNSKSQTPCVTPAGAVADSWQSWKLR